MYHLKEISYEEARKEFFINMLTHKYRREYNSKISKYYTKADFEYVRKNTDDSFVVVQKNEIIESNVKNAEIIDYSKRWHVVHTRKMSNSFGDIWIYEVELLPYTGSKRSVTYKINSGYQSNPKDRIRELNDIIDKSGYFVCCKRDLLKKNAETLRAKRKKEEYLQNDYSENVSSLNEYFQLTKNRVCEYLKNASTEEEYRIVSDFALTLRIKFGSLLRFNERTEKKEHNSIEEMERDYDYIHDSLVILNERIDGKDGESI